MRKTHQPSIATLLERHFGTAVLEALERPDVTDVLINPDGVVRYETFSGPVATSWRIEPVALEAILLLLADERGSRLSEADAFFAARLPAEEPFTGARLHAVLPPVTTAPAITIRVHAPEIFGLSDFATPREVATLEELVRAPRNVLIVGGTSTGKTSLLSALLKRLAQVHPQDRVVCMEDVAEIEVSSLNHVPMTTEGSRFTLEQLVRNALRMRPDRMVVGEVRGAEAMGLIDAWSTGHTGGLGTLHAEEPRGALLRLESLARRSRRAGAASLATEIAGAVDVVVVMRRGGDLRPCLGGIHSVAPGLEVGEYQIKPL